MDKEKNGKKRKAICYRLNVRFDESTFIRSEKEQEERNRTMKCRSCGYKMFMKNASIGPCGKGDLGKKRTMYPCSKDTCPYFVCEACIVEHPIICSCCCGY